MKFSPTSIVADRIHSSCLCRFPVPNKMLWGHGVGMSASGAPSMASDGKNYKEILKLFLSRDSSDAVLEIKNHLAFKRAIFLTNHLQKRISQTLDATSSC